MHRSSLTGHNSVSSASPIEAKPASHSDSSVIESSGSETLASDLSLNETTPFERRSLLWRRLITGACFIILGGASAAIGIATLQFRFTHLIVDNALVNGRAVQLQSPTDGRIKEWYARPGVAVPSGQILARIEQSSKNEQTLLQLTGEVRLNQAQLAAAEQTSDQLNRQLQNLEGQRQAFQSLDVTQTDNLVNERQAILDAAAAQVDAARNEYERYANLLSDGAVSALRVEQLRSSWIAAAAELKQSQASLQSAQTSLSASEQRVPSQSVSTNLLQQWNQLTQSVQTQSTLIRTLKAQLEQINNG
ncbi:MAG: biotin/lipoyl-binding protein [Leptolyngbyaceae cyanobacterium CRU_2_3]|nr:biotin/lipoyl-binding protein [Leptolyngbyaceae cyanobacterium CRU_2_3]